MTDQNLIDILLRYCDAVDNATQVLRNELKALEKTTTPQPTELKATIPENRFDDLKWKDENGAKIGAYQIALIQDNDEQDWRHTYNILKANNAEIGNRFHEHNYEHSYWLYSKMEYKIFRQQMREAQK